MMRPTVFRPRPEYRKSRRRIHTPTQWQYDTPSLEGVTGVTFDEIGIEPTHKISRVGSTGTQLVFAGVNL